MVKLAMVAPPTGSEDEAGEWSVVEVAVVGFPWTYADWGVRGESLLAICRAHHCAVRALRVWLVSSLMAAASARTSESARK